MRYSKDKPFGEQVDEVLNGKDTNSTHLLVRDRTPNFLLDLGLSNKPMLITATHTKTAVGVFVKNKNIHSIAKDVFISLPKLLESPVIAIESKKPNSTVLFVNAKAANKTHQDSCFMHKLFTLISYDNNLFFTKVNVEEYFSESNTNKRLYHLESIKIEPTDKRFDSSKPPSLNTSDIGSTISIFKLHELVNTYDKNFNPKPVSKELLNEDGTPKVVYHGTDEALTVFDKEKSNNRYVWGKGLYFSKSKGVASDYGKNLYAAYLSVKNPYINRKSSLGTADYIKDKYFKDMWTGNNRQLGIEYINGKLGNNPLDLLQYMATENNVEVADILADYGYDGIIDGSEIVVFESTQIKSATYNIGTFDSTNADIRYSQDLIDNYSKEQYNDYGWARVNVLDSRQYADFNRKFSKPTAEMLNNRTKNGELIIPVNKQTGETFGVNNVLVFAKGTYQNPQITRIIEIDLNNETDIDKERRYIYASERRGVERKVNGLLKYHIPTDYGFERTRQRNRHQNETNSRNNGYRSGSGGEARSIKSIHFNDDGSQEVSYSDGTNENIILFYKFRIY